MLRVTVATLAVLHGFVAPAAAQTPTTPDYFQGTQTNAVRIRKDRPRTRSQRLLVGGLLGGAALFTGAGLYLHYDSHQIAKALSATRPKNVRWSGDLADRYARGQTRGTLAIASYGVGVALVAAAVVVWIKSDPGSETVEISRPLTIAPLPGGIAMEATWCW